MKLIFEPIHPQAQRPEYATQGSACFDIRACHPQATELTLTARDSTTYWTIEPGAAASIATGLKMQVPKGTVLQLFSRSGHGFVKQVCLANGTGIIDSDYSGEIMVMLINHGKQPFVVEHGDRIAQAMLVPIPRVRLFVGKVMPSASRVGGFGSTGVQ